MKVWTFAILVLCLLTVIQQTEGKKKRRGRKRQKLPKSTTQAPSTTPITTATTTSPLPRDTPTSAEFSQTSITLPVAAGACRRTCEGDSYLQHEQCICVCDPGYEYNSRNGRCEDIDECEDESNCIGGACTNYPGSYYCICPTGYNLHANGKRCQPVPNVLPCRGLICLSEAQLNWETCRCDCLNGGLSYDYFEEVCQDIDECAFDLVNCQQGCINTVGSFLCYCFRDFSLNSDGATCSAKPAPGPSNTECFGKCPGATSLNLLSCDCMCETGFKYIEFEQQCVDIDECEDFLGWCQGICENNIGSYTCTCPPGTIQDADGWSCIDIPPPTEQLQCLEYEMLCDHGSECVQESVICDGYNDCGDGSDEKDCNPMCRPSEFSCANGRKCLEASLRCNGENDCLDHSDELDCPCEDQKDQCRSWQIRGECETNPGWMNLNCRDSCKACLKDDGTESGVLVESEDPELYFLRDSESFATSLQYTLRTTGSRQQASGSRWKCDIITKVPRSVRNEFRLSFAYRKYAQAYNIPILGTDRVSDEAMRRACYVVRFLFADRRDLREAFYRSWGRIAVMGSDEVTVNIPEHSHLPELYNAVRGLGGTLHIPVASGATENLLCLGDDPNSDQDTMVHTLAHTIKRIPVTSIIVNLRSRLNGAYVNARKNEMWAHTKALYTTDEYFAQGVLSFFNVSSGTNINTREKLERYDPALYNLVKEVFPCINTIVDRCDADQSRRDTKQIKMNCNEGPARPVDEENTADGDCRNLHHECPQWEEEGGCQSNEEWMSNNCPKSCNTCPTPKEEPVDELTECQDMDEQCLKWVQQGRCDIDGSLMWTLCRKSCGMCEGQEDLNLRLQDDYDTSSHTECVDSHFLCKLNAKAGECISNESWMREHCPFSCDLCSVPSAGDDSRFNCQDDDPICSGLVGTGECVDEWLRSSCRASCSLCNEIPDKVTISTTSVPEDGSICIDVDPFCSEWADAGECRDNPEYMEALCPESCGYCTHPDTDVVPNEATQSPTTSGTTTVLPVSMDKDACIDTDKYCADWSNAGECLNNPGYMEIYCTKTCGLCSDPGDQECIDTNRYCPDWAVDGDCESNPEWMSLNCRLSCGICNTPIHPEDSDCKDVHSHCKAWADSGNCETDSEWMIASCPRSCNVCHILKEPTPGSIEPNCEDSDPLCPGWAFYGGCYQNPGWMLLNCAFSCNSCHYLSTDESEVDSGLSSLPSVDCMDTDSLCPEWAINGACETVPELMMENCPASCNFCGDTEETTSLPFRSPTDTPTISDENDSYPKPVETTALPENSEPSEISDWVGEDTDSSDSWLESQISYFVEDSNLETSFDQSSQSDFEDDEIVQNLPEESLSMTTDDEETTVESAPPSTTKPTTPSVETLSTSISVPVTNFTKSGENVGDITNNTDWMGEGIYNSDSWMESQISYFVENSEMDTSFQSSQSSQSLPEESLSMDTYDKATSVQSIAPSIGPSTFLVPTHVSVLATSTGENVRDTSTDTINVATSFHSVTDLSSFLNEFVTDDLQNSRMVTDALNTPQVNDPQLETDFGGNSDDILLQTTDPRITKSRGVFAMESTTTSLKDEVTDSNIKDGGAPTFTQGYTKDSNFNTRSPATLPTSGLDTRSTSSIITDSPAILTSLRNSGSYTTRGSFFRPTQSIVESIAPTVITDVQETQEITTRPEQTNKLLQTSQTECADYHSDCPIWASHEGCRLRPKYMLMMCRESCKLCDHTEATTQADTDLSREVSLSDCEDTNKYCIAWAASGGCETNPRFMRSNCRRSCNTCDYSSSIYEDNSFSESEINNLVPADDSSLVSKQFTTRSPYLDKDPMTSGKTPDGEECADSTEFCTAWAEYSGCIDNPGWMLLNCRKSCNSCDYTGEEQESESQSSASWSDESSYSVPQSDQHVETTTARPSHQQPTPACIDLHRNCETWASQDECTRNPRYMLRSCRLSCNSCGDVASGCIDGYGPSCEGWASTGECDANSFWMRRNCRKSCNTCDVTFAEDLCNDNFDKCPKWTEEGECDYDVDWMRSNCARSCGMCDKSQAFHFPRMNFAIDSVEKECLNHYDNCTDWARIGECESNSSWMRVNCCPACLEDVPSYCVDKDERCVNLTKDGACDFDREWMLVHCRMSCHACNISHVRIPASNCLDEGEYCAELALAGECNADPEWMQRHCCYSCSLVTEDVSGCADLKRDCQKWAEDGECDTNPEYMKNHCAKSCDTCSLCQDDDPSRCLELANQGQCVADPATMLAFCPKTCNMCF